jgi:hypothetical protein
MKSNNNFSYFLSMVDDLSRFTWDFCYILNLRHVHSFNISFKWLKLSSTPKLNVYVWIIPTKERRGGGEPRH